MGFQACDDLVDGGALTIVCIVPISAKFVEFTSITFFKGLIDNIGDVSWVVWAVVSFFR